MRSKQHPQHSTSLDPLVGLQRVPLKRRVAKRLGMLSRSNLVSFVLLFGGFVLLGTTVEFVLEGREAATPFASFFASLWFTVVTITTVGYGDMAPTGTAGKIFAMAEMLMGIGLVGVITGSVASILVESNRKTALGLTPLRHVSGHTIICGWKHDLRDILLGILDANPELSSTDLVLVTTQPPPDIGELRRERRLRALHYVAGSHTERSVLEMASMVTAARVIILADEARNAGREAVDSRTVLAATTVQALNQRVYTCTELNQPHFVKYLRHAQVEEVVLGAKNARALLVAASLGDGVSNIITRLFPEHGNQLRVISLPRHLRGSTYAEVATWARQDRGLLPLGLMDNTGNLHDRKTDRLREALRQPDYASAVAMLGQVKSLTSNSPRFGPAPDHRVGEHTAILALLPSTVRQDADEAQRRSGQYPQVRDPRPEQLVICGWKPDMANLLFRIVDVHRQQGRHLAGVTVVANLPDAEAQAISDDAELPLVKVMQGEPTEPETLERAGIRDAERVLVLGDPAGGTTTQESDARNVMISIAIHDLNRRAYKGVEIYNQDLGVHLKVASVEEIVFTRRYQQVMLVQAALGTGLASAIDDMLFPGRPLLRVMNFPAGRLGKTFGQHAQGFLDRGQTLIGVVDHAGNYQLQKDAFLYDAQVQPQIGNAIDQLLRWKSVVSNQPVLNPGNDYVPGDLTRAVVIIPDKEGQHG